MSDYTVLVYEEIPENSSIYLIPNEEVEKDNRWQLMRLAHQKFINQDESNEGMRFLSHALVDEKHIDEDEYFDDGYTNYPGGERILEREPAPREWRCVFAKYRQDADKVIEGVTVTRVIVSGFHL